MTSAWTPPEVQRKPNLVLECGEARPPVVPPDRREGRIYRHGRPRHAQHGHSHVRHGDEAGEEAAHDGPEAPPFAAVPELEAIDHDVRPG